MISYEGAAGPIRDDLLASHRRFWDRLAAPGAWWTGAERLAIAEETRGAARCALCRERKAALTPHTVTGSHDRGTELPDAAVEAVHFVVTDPGRITRRWYDAVLAQGLGVEQYVELVGTVAAVISIDSFCRGIGVPPHPFPPPRPGAPSRYRPESAGPDEAWVPMVPMDNAGTPEADLWPAGQTGNVIRALSLVPDEVRTLSDLGAAHYLPAHLVRDPTATKGSLTRPQIEFVAGRVSVLNGCFY